MRYINNGRRIDAFWLDGSLWIHALRGPPLVDDEATEQGAVRAATAGGRWLPAPTHGMLQGLQEAKQSTHDMQFVPPHTGMIYTAPAASDHIAVSVLVSAGALGRSLPYAQIGSANTELPPPPPLKPPDAPTKACVFRPQASLRAFFAPKPKPPGAASMPLSEGVGTKVKVTGGVAGAGAGDAASGSIEACGNLASTSASSGGDGDGDTGNDGDGESGSVVHKRPRMR